MELPVLFLYFMALSEIKDGEIKDGKCTENHPIARNWSYRSVSEGKNCFRIAEYRSMNKFLLTTTLALVFGTSAFVSVSGLSAVFSSAGITIILMGAGMELGKILTVIHLHRRWKVLYWLSRCFYIMVIVALVLITSCEIMGYLSQNHVQGFRALESNHASLTALEQEEKILRNRIETIDNTLAGLPDSYVTKRIRERENAGYEGLQARLTEVIKNKAIIQNEKIADTAYSAPIFATARIFRINETRVASLFIFFLVCVLEPLSIGLAVAVSIAWLPVKQESVKSDTAIGTETAQKEDAYNIKQDAGISVKIDTTDPVVASIIHLIDSAGKWSGTVSELLVVLNNTDTQGFVGKNGWPDDAHSLGKRLKRLEQKLSEQGIYTKRSRTQKSRKVEIGRVESIGNV